MPTTENLIPPGTKLVEYPALIDRFQSTLIDIFFAIALMFGFSQLLDNFQNVSDQFRVGVFIAVWLLYEPVCTAFGYTLGNYMKDIRVRKRNDPSERINVFQAFVRYLLKITLGWISFLTIHANDEKRALHDLVAGSVMVRNQGSVS